MRHARGLLAVLLALVFVSESQAQVGITLRGRRLSTSFYLGRPYGFRGIGPGFGGWGRPYIYGAPWWGPRYRSFVFIPPPPVFAPPLIINNPAPIFNVQADPVPQVDLIDPIVIRPRRVPPDGPPPMPEAPLPGAPRGGFRPVLPEDRARAQQPVIPRLPADQRPPAGVEPDANPKADAARQLAQGKLAFAAQEHGTAERCFQRAATLLPDEPLPYFLLAQTQFALGKYQEAVASIHAGLRLKPDWPGIAFRPIELYAANVADYTEHLDQLRDALRRNPKDPVLLFLLAYQLWFDGQKEEARILFRRAAALVVDPKFIDLFLRQNLPGDRVVMR